MTSHELARLLLSLPEAAVSAIGACRDGDLKEVKEKDVKPVDFLRGKPGWIEIIPE